MDVLMEDTVDQATFKRAVSLIHTVKLIKTLTPHTSQSVYLQPHQYHEILHERHLNSHCSYPLCPKPPKAAYTSSKRIQISTTKRSIKEIEGNPEDGFCAKICKVRSQWAEKGLEKHTEPIWLRSGKGEAVELLEELEDRGELSFVGGDLVFGSATSNRTVEGNISVQVTNGEASGTPEVIRSTVSNAPIDKKMSDPTTTEAGGTPTSTLTSDMLIPSTSPSTAPTKKVGDLLSQLKIVERPTPLTRPIAPSLSPNRPTDISSIPTPTATPSPTPIKASSFSAKRQPPSSMLSTSTTRLASTLISASKGLAGAVNAAQQVGEDSDEEEDWEEEWEREMGWGDEGDEEFQRLFEEAKMARELVEAERSGT